MAQGDAQIAAVGSLVADPELKCTQDGAAVASFRIASTPWVYRDGQWVSGEGVFLTYSLWHEAAGDAVGSLSKGIRIIVQSRLRRRSYETRKGERRTIFEVEVDEVGPPLKFIRTQVTHAPRNGGRNFGGGNRGQGGNTDGGFDDDFGGDQGNRGGQSDRDFDGGAPAEDPWNSAPPAGGSFGGDEPPF